MANRREWMRRLTSAVAIGVGLTAAMASIGCTKLAPPDPAAMAAWQARPLPDRMITKVDELRTETPASIAAQDGVLLVMRAYSEKVTTSFLTGGKTTRDAALVLLAEAPSTSTIAGKRGSPMLSGKDTPELDTTGWAVTIARPGKYFLDTMTAGAGHGVLMSGKARRDNAEAFGQTVAVKAGEVVYLGTMRTRAEGDKTSMGVDDETAAAKAYLARELPAFAPVMTTRLIDCGCNVKTKLEDALAAINAAATAPATKPATAKAAARN